MTTVFLNVKKCFICGAQNRCPDSGTQAGYTGAKDLDTRPCALQRSSVYMRVQRCISCGYCAHDISRGTEAARAVVAGDSYQTQISNPRFSDTANSFLCQCLILEQQKDFPDAGWTCVFAAWICDDNAMHDAAADCRRQAISLFARAGENKQRYAADKNQEMLLMIDLLRRSGQFEPARKRCEIELNMDCDDDTFAILSFQMKLIDAGDARCHTVRDALEAG